MVNHLSDQVCTVETIDLGTFFRGESSARKIYVDDPQHWGSPTTSWQNEHSWGQVEIVQNGDTWEIIVNVDSSDLALHKFRDELAVHFGSYTHLIPVEFQVQSDSEQTNAPPTPIVNPPPPPQPAPGGWTRVFTFLTYLFLFPFVFIAWIVYGVFRLIRWSAQSSFMLAVVLILGILVAALVLTSMGIYFPPLTNPPPTPTATPKPVIVIPTQVPTKTPQPTRTPQPTPTITNTPTPDHSPKIWCGDDYSHIEVGMYAVVALDLDSQFTTYNLRAEADVRSAIVGGLNSNTLMQVLSGPKCANGYTWWYIQTLPQYTNGISLSGWIAESVDGVYHILPRN